MAVTPWSYRKGRTLLHRMPAGAKLLFLLAISLAAFFPGTEKTSLVILTCIVFVLSILSLVAHIYPWKLLRGSGPLFLVVFAVFLFRGIKFDPPFFSGEGILYSVIFCIRIGAAFASGSLLFAVTTIAEIRRSLSRPEKALHLEKIRIGLSISLMLAFMKRFFEIWEDINLAWKSRGGRRSVSRFLILLPVVLERMMIKAAETASAIESRGGADSQ